MKFGTAGPKLSPNPRPKPPTRFHFPTSTSSILSITRRSILPPSRGTRRPPQERYHKPQPSGIDQQNPGGRRARRSWCGRGARGADGDGVEALREALRHKSRGGRRGSRPGCSGRERVLVQAQPRHCGRPPAVPLRRSRGSVSADAYAPQDPGGGRAAPSLAVPEGRLRERPGARARRWPRRSLPPSQGRRPREGEAKLGNFVDARVARERASER